MAVAHVLQHARAFISHSALPTLVALFVEMCIALVVFTSLRMGAL
jgi:hypothetical protein